MKDGKFLYKKLFNWHFQYKDTDIFYVSSYGNIFTERDIITHLVIKYSQIYR